MIGTFSRTVCEIKPQLFLPEEAFDLEGSEQANNDAMDWNRSANTTGSESQIPSAPPESGTVMIDKSKCRACGQVPRRSDGHVARPHVTGFCVNCRKNTVVGKEALRLCNRAREEKLRENKKKEGTYTAYIKQRVQYNSKHRKWIKKNDQERYKRLFLDPNYAYYANRKVNNPIGYQRHLDQVKETHDRMKKENDLAWIAYIEQHRLRCTREGCDITIPCCIQFNHIDPTKKKFNMTVDEFLVHKQGTTAEWKAEQDKVEALCLFHHVDVTFSHSPEAIDAKPTGSASVRRMAVKQFKLAAKGCATCGKTIQLSSPSFVKPVELAKFHVDHISRSTKTTQREGLNVTDVGLQLLCAHCHCMKTTGENYHMFETVLSTYLWNHIPLWFRSWFAINTHGEDWKQRRQDWMDKYYEGKKKADKRRKFENIEEEIEQSENDIAELVIDEIDPF